MQCVYFYSVAAMQLETCKRLGPICEGSEISHKNQSSCSLVMVKRNKTLCVVVSVLNDRLVESVVTSLVECGSQHSRPAPCIPESIYTQICMRVY